MAERIGTVVGLRPGSRAIRTPVVATGVRPARAAVATTVAVRSGVARSARLRARVARRAATNAITRTPTTTTTVPMASTVQSKSRPGAGSARRATTYG